MKGIKTESVSLNMPYVDFIKYILNKLDYIEKSTASYIGCGFESTNPMGGVKNFRTGYLDANFAMIVIPKMEGVNGEVIIAKQGRTGMFGNLIRRGSVAGGIDVYETNLIDKDYNLKTLKLYFNGYGRIAEGIVIADGFTLKEYGQL